MYKEIMGISFLEQMQPQFSAPVRQRGEMYCNQGLVDIKTFDHQKIEAVVKGSEKYEVEIDIDKHSHLTMYCTCAYFLDAGENCKHLWATLIEVSRQWHLMNPASPKEDVPGEGEQPCIHHHPLMVSRFKKSRDWRVLLPPTDNSDNSKSQKKVKSPQRFYPFFILDRELSTQSGEVVLIVEERYLKSNGVWGRSRPLKTEGGRLLYEKHKNPADHRAMELVSSLMARREYSWPRSYTYQDKDKMAENVCLSPSIAWGILSILADTDRLYLRINEIDKINSFRSRYREVKLKIEQDGGWELKIFLPENEEEDSYHLCPLLVRQHQSISLIEPDLVFSGHPHWFIYQGMIHHLATTIPSSWLQELRKPSPIQVDQTEISEFLEKAGGDFLDTFILPRELEFLELRDAHPHPELCIAFDNKELLAHLTFRYHEHYLTDQKNPNETIHDFNRRGRVWRDFALEDEYVQFLQHLGFEEHTQPDFEWHLPQGKDTLNVLQELLKNPQWAVLGHERKKIRSSSGFRLTVGSGVDWLSLDGKIEFDDQIIPLTTIMKRYKRGERFVALGDGTIGLLPEEWLKQHHFALNLGTKQAGKNGLFRFSHSQIGLLDLLLNSTDKSCYDEDYQKIRDRLQNFQTIKPVTIPTGFIGTLRPYQKRGLDWLVFLNEFKFGGCLADDMGLGKTVQILALLEYLKEKKNKEETALVPCLVVVPTSLISNWQKEAQRFTPHLQVLLYLGSNRKNLTENLYHYDLIITTYGILRRDISWLKDYSFCYLILDEAQVIKNHQTQIAKSCLLIKAEHRLSVTGTPLENHIGELWSQFEFLNPSMLGTYEEFIHRFRSKKEEPSTNHELLKRLIAPFLLRRTKEDVEPQLPGKIEQTLYCDMGDDQRKIYNQLRDVYRADLMRAIDQEGLNSVRFKVLEGLLRLRQICCHPMILSKIHPLAGETSSGKFDALREMLTNVIEEGHKALIFSQFTTMLRIIRQWLGQNSINYQYLDGCSRDRESRINQFQEDSDCRLFLISLKAGGFGLNLTAADYVFLYDPWWNPAVETQAVDRTHRIGQQKKVFTYRLIVKDSVEEKIQKLQAQKQDLVKNIISAGDGFINQLTKEDIMALFS